MELVEVEVWVVVDEGGDYAIAKNSEDLAQAYEDDIGGAIGDQNSRRVKITVKVPLPKPVELVATIAEEPASGELKVA